MKTNTKLAIVFALATGLMSGSATIADAVSAGAQSNLHFEVQDVTIGGNSDKIFWSVAGDANSAVAKSNEVQDLGIRSPAPPPTDPLDFLGSSRGEIRRDFVYQPSFDSAALPPEAPQDPAPSLMDVYNDRPGIIMAQRENPGLDNRVWAVLAAAYPAPCNDSFNQDGSRVTPDKELLVELAAVAPTPEETPPTIDSRYILAAANAHLLSQEQIRYLGKVFTTILKYEKEGLVFPLPLSITEGLIKIKDQVNGILTSCNHDAFHNDGKDPAGSPCVPGET